MTTMTNSNFARQLAATIPLFVLAVCATGLATAGSPKNDRTTWPAYVQQFLADYFTEHPGFAITSGKHEFDGQIADFSEAGLTKEIARLHAARTTTAAFTDNQLDDRQRFE